MKKKARFSHVPEFTGYMKIVFELLSYQSAGLKILDIPAGNGLLGERLRSLGHTVVCADINAEREDYIYADMSMELPFGDAEFDIVICMEGLEHLLEPSKMVSELCRVVRPNGRIIVTLPNLQSYYSRLKFLFSGSFYQFEPEGGVCHPNGEALDRGHVSPLGWVQLCYLFGEFGWQNEHADGDRIKRKAYLPLYILLHVAASFVLWARMRRTYDPFARSVYPNLMRFKLQLSRSLITVWKKG